MVWSLRCCGRLDSPMEAAIVVVLSALRRRTHLTAKVTKLTLRERCLPTDCGCNKTVFFEFPMFVPSLSW